MAQEPSGCFSIGHSPQLLNEPRRLTERITSPGRGTYRNVTAYWPGGQVTAKPNALKTPKINTAAKKVRFIQPSFPSSVPNPETFLL